MFRFIYGPSCLPSAHSVRKNRSSVHAVHGTARRSANICWVNGQMSRRVPALGFLAVGPQAQHVSPRASLFCPPNGMVRLTGGTGGAGWRKHPHRLGWERHPVSRLREGRVHPFLLVASPPACGPEASQEEKGEYHLRGTGRCGREGGASRASGGVAGGLSRSGGGYAEGAPCGLG